MSERLARRLLIIGWDAADWQFIEPLFTRGLLPNLRRVVDQGVRADLASLEPRLSPLLWTTVATGKTADKHGILNFVEPDPAGEGVRIASSTSRKTKALWNILTQAGLRTNVVSWYASHPAEPISGVCVSNLFQESMPASPEDAWPPIKGSVHPADWSDRIAEVRVHPADLYAEEMQALLPSLGSMDPADARIKLLARHVARCASVHAAATEVLASSAKWDCTMVFYDTIDTIGHHFMQYHPPRLPHVSERDFEWYRHVMTGVYQMQDMMLGVLLKMAGPETALMLLSDHGFHDGANRPVTAGMSDEHRAEAEASWHRPLGILAMAGPGIVQGETLHGTNLLDIAPTSLTILGLPVGMDMGGRVLTEAFAKPPHVGTVFSWDMADGESGMHPAELRQDPFEARDAVSQLVDLGYMPALPADSQAMFELVRRETQFNLGMVLATTGRAAQAVPILRELTTGRPDDRRYVMALVRSLTEAGLHGEVVTLISAWLAKQPADREARLLLAMALAMTGDVAKAGAELDRLESAHDGRPELEALLGEVCIATGRWDDAARHYEAALSHAPQNPAVHHGLARAALGRDLYEAAAEHCLKAIELLHFYPTAHQTLGIALTWLKDYPHAIQSFEIAVSMKPDLLDSHRYLASIHRMLGDRISAGRHRDRAKQILADHAEGQTSGEFLRREAPMSPLQWSRAVGITEDEEG